FTYDAWNRLTAVERWNPSAGSGGAYQMLSAYEYNGLHWRTRSLAWNKGRNSTTGPNTLGGDYAQERIYTYNAAWQAIVEEIDDARDTSTSPGTPSATAPQQVAQQVFGIRGVNDAVYRRQADDPEDYDWNQLSYDGAAFSGEQYRFFDKSFYQLGDGQGSI